MLRHSRLRIAVVAGEGACALGADLASGLGARGHRVQLHAGDAGCERLARRLRAEPLDVVSHHASDASSFAAVEGLPALHTLHVAPTERLVRAALRARGAFATASVWLARAWQDAGLERVQVVPAGVPDSRRLPAVVRPLALVVDRDGAMAALRAGLGITMLRTGDDAARKLAHSAVCIAARGSACVFDRLAAQAQLLGCPVVGYADEPLAELVEDGVSGFLVAPGDAPGLAATVRRAAALDRHAVRESARRRLAFERLLDRYESELRAIARRTALRLVA